MDINRADLVKWGFLFLVIALIAYIVYVNHMRCKTQYVKESIKDKDTSHDNKENNKIVDKNLTVVLYKQKTCPHCVDFMPTWEALQKKFNELDISHKTLECTEEPCDGIQYIPTIRVFKDDKYVEYKGDRTQKDIMDFISKV